MGRSWRLPSIQCLVHLLPRLRQLPLANLLRRVRLRPGHAAVVDADARAAVSRTLVAAAAAGQLSPAQKQTLAQIVAERTGLSQAEAEKRVRPSLCRCPEGAGDGA